MTSLALPDVSVWLALLLEDHVHRTPAIEWWNSNPFRSIAFSRFTQISVLRLLTTAAVMNERPLTMAAAWKAYDRFFQDDRVSLLAEPGDLESLFRQSSLSRGVSPKLWADAYVLALAHNGVCVSFDQALVRRAPGTVLLETK